MSDTTPTNERELVQQLARAALAVRYERPPRDKIYATEAALAPLVAEWQKAPRREAERLSRQLDAQKEKASAEREKLQGELAALRLQIEVVDQRAEASEQATERLTGELGQTREQLATAVGAMEEARDVAREVWRVLPAESKLALFESDAGWVPKWIAQPRAVSTSTDQRETDAE